MTTSPQFLRKYPPPSVAEIRALRESAGLSVAAMANLCSIAPSSWRKFEDGAIMPAPIWKLARMVVEQMKHAEKKPP